jgi:hypothetical protein
MCQFPKPTAANCQSPLQRTGYAVDLGCGGQLCHRDLQRTAGDFGKLRVSAADFDQDCRGLWQGESLYFNGNRCSRLWKMTDPELVRRPQTDPQMRRHSAPFRFLSIFRKESARNCASADELGHGAGDGFGLLPSHRQ